MLKDKTIFVPMEQFHLRHKKISLWEDRTFYYKVSFALTLILTVRLTF